MQVFEQVTKINLFGSVYVAKYCAIAMSKNKPLNEKGEKGVIIFVLQLLQKKLTVVRYFMVQQKVH